MLRSANDVGRESRLELPMSTESFITAVPGGTSLSRGSGYMRRSTRWIGRIGH